MNNNSSSAIAKCAASPVKSKFCIASLQRSDRSPSHRSHRSAKMKATAANQSHQLFGMLYD